MIHTWSLWTCIVALITLSLTHWIYRWRNPKCKGNLPPGSSGLPLIGETLNPLMSSNSFGPPPFIRARLEKYGPLFRSKIAFRNVVISADPQVNNFLILQEGKLVDWWSLDIISKLFQLGETSSDTLYMDKYIRERFLRHFGAESVKEKLLTEFQETVCRALESWSSQDSVEVKSAAATMLIQAGAKIVVSCDREESVQLLNQYNRIFSAIVSLPINIPGTSYHKALKAKEQLLEIISGKVKARLASSRNRPGDFLDLLLEDMKNEKHVTIDLIVQLLFTLIFLTFGAVSMACALAIYWISENPSVLDELLVEHQEILQKKDNSSSSITWQEFKSMTFTLQVINETLRMGVINPAIFRKAKKDIEINGYTIPKGWGIIITNAAAHFNPDIYKDPFKFNPWRWKDLQPDVRSKNFMPFGGGIRHCVGAEYSRAFMCIFLHVLVTKYRWKKLGGLHIKLTKHN